MFFSYLHPFPAYINIADMTPIIYKVKIIDIFSLLSKKLQTSLIVWKSNALPRSSDWRIYNIIENGINHTDVSQINFSLIFSVFRKINLSWSPQVIIHSLIGQLWCTYFELAHSWKVHKFIIHRLINRIFCL